MADNPTETRSDTEPIQKRKQHSGHGERGKGRGGSDRKSTSNNNQNPQGDEKKRRNQNQKNKSSKKSDVSAVEQARVDKAPKLTEEELLLKAEQDALAAKEAEDAKIRAKLLADKETLEHSLSSKIANIQEFVSKIEIHKGYRHEVSAEALKSSRLKFAGNKTKLKSDLKKCTAFIRKVKSAPTFDALTVKSLINDLDTLNLTRYLEEIAQGLVENKSRKVSDVMGLTQLCHALHVRYDNWMDEFTPRVLSVLKDKNSDPKHRRIIVRVMVEMVLFGIGEIKPVLKVLADAAGSPGTNGGENYEVADANMIISIVKSGSYELIGIVPNTILKDVENLENVTISYQNNLHGSSLCAESDHGSDIDTSKTIHVPLSPSQKLLDEAIEAVRRFRDVKESLAVPSEVCERFQKHLNGAFLFLSNLLVSTHKKLSKMKKRCAQDRLLAGTLPEQREKALEDAIQLMDSMFKSVEVLADSLNKSIPELVEEVDEVKEDTTKLEVYKGDDGQTDLGPFDDEDAKDFYCNIPDLLSTIPPVLLGYKEEEVERLKDLNKAKYSFESDDAGEHRDLTDEAKVREDAIIDAIDESEDHFDVSAEGKAEEDEEVKDTPHFKLLAMIEEELPECNRRDKVDALAEKFCTTHGAANKSRKRLEKAIFLVPRSRLDLIPYYSRLSAILDRVFPDITSALVSELEQQFHGLAKWKKQSSLESRVRNARFIGELTKFRVAPPIVALRCFARCLDDFSGYNVDIACCLLESCGRFLFKTKHTSTKIAKIMDTMDRIRKAKHFDERATELIKSSFYIVKPPQIKNQKKAKVLSPIESYIKDLLLVRLDRDNINFVSNQILRLPWNDEVFDFGFLVVKYMLKTCRKGRYKSINAIASLAGKLKKHKSELIARLIDTVIEELQFILEKPSIRDQQRAITYAKLLGELHTQTLIPAQAIIDELYHFINFGHDIPKDLYNVSSEHTIAPSISSSLLKKSSLGITQPIKEDEEMEEEEDECDAMGEIKSDVIADHPSPIGVSLLSVYDPRVPSALDPPSAVFRVKLICTLLDSSAPSLVSTTTATLVNNFLTAFQRYLFIKQTLPTDIEFSLLDTFDILESRFRSLKKGSSKPSSITRYECWLDAHNAVIAIEEADIKVNERTDLRLLAQAGMKTTLTDDDEGVLDEDVPSEDDDSYGNSVDTAEEDDISIDESEEEDYEDEDSEEDESQIANDESDDESVRDRDEEDEITAQEEHMRQMEDEAFEREIRMLTMEAIEKGKVSARTTAISKVSDSMPAASQFNRKKQSLDSQNDNTETNALALTGNDGIPFQLIKRGTKGKAETKSLIIPKDTNLAKIATTKDTAADRERDMLKARVLQYEKESESTRSGDVYFDQPKVKDVRNRTLRSYDIDDEFGRTSFRPGRSGGRGTMYGGRGSPSGRGLKHF